MHRSFENWSEKFAFSDELEVLEESLSMQADDSEGAAQTSQTSSTDTSAANPAPSLSLDRFINLVTEGVLTRISDETYLEKFLNTRELRRDNQMLAAQVKHLLKENKQLQQELANRGSQLGSYKQIAGNIFLKID